MSGEGGQYIQGGVGGGGGGGFKYILGYIVRGDTFSRGTLYPPTGRYEQRKAFGYY